jgi:glucose-1-phosphate cytidylyltransferase
MMKTVILCGGRGTRLGEHGVSVPKALIDIGGQPVLWHIINLYAHFGLGKFILGLGHLGEEIKRYFTEHHATYRDFKLEMSAGDAHPPGSSTGKRERSIAFVDTGLTTNTGGRIKRVEAFLADDENFCVTYGDGLADIDLRALINFHQEHGRIATLTAVHPQSNFGLLKIDSAGAITEFQEKPPMKEWSNGGFFVFRRRIFDYLNDNSVLESETFECLANERQLMAYFHTGFWKCMDTYKDNVEFNQLWETGQTPWKVW